MNDILIGKSDSDVYPPARCGNRRSMIAGATGSGRRRGMLEALAISAARTAGGRFGRDIMPGVLGARLRK